MTRDNRITIYVDDDTAREIERHAVAEDETISTHLDRVIRRYYQMEADNQHAREVKAEERIRELVTLAADEVRGAAEDLRETNAKTGAYAAATFDLVADDRRDGRERDALETGSERMAEPLQTTLNDLPGNDETDREGPLDRIQDNE
jgi:hypothetical protein